MSVCILKQSNMDQVCVILLEIINALLKYRGPKLSFYSHSMCSNSLRAYLKQH